jgi:hypothetical protein
VSTDSFASEELHVSALSLVTQVRALQRAAIRPETQSAFTAPRVLADADALHDHVVRYVAEAPTSPDGSVLPEVAAILDVVREALVLVDDLVGDVRQSAGADGPLSAPEAP